MKITWQVRDGRQAEVEVALKTSEVVSLDGHEVEVACCEMEIVGRLEGQVMGYDARRIDHPQIAGVCGKLGIPAAQMDQIEAAIAEVEASPIWQARLIQEQKEQIAYEQAHKSEARIRRAMEEDDAE